MNNVDGGMLTIRPNRRCNHFIFASMPFANAARYWPRAIFHSLLSVALVRRYAVPTHGVVGADEKDRERERERETERERERALRLDLVI